MTLLDIDHNIHQNQRPVFFNPLDLIKIPKEALYVGLAENGAIPILRGM